MCCADLQMVGTQGGYQVSRAAPSQSDETHFSDVLQPAASALNGSHMVRSSRQALGRALRSVSGHWRQRHMQTQPATKPAGAHHAVLTVEGVPAPTPRHRGSRGWLAWVHPSKPSALKGELLTANGVGGSDIAMKSPFEVERGPSFAGTGSAAPSVMGSSAVDVEAGAMGDTSEEFVINPRLTLVFRDVWVADIPIEESLAHKAKRRVLGLCRKPCPEASELSYIHGSSGSSSRKCVSRQEEMYAKLEEAAASSAFFIVPGVSSRFPHSQLHAIMGPSGCGEYGGGLE